MKKTPLTPPRQGQPWQRDQLIEILSVAAAVNEYSFIRKTALSWLAIYPGDLPVQLIHARSAAKTTKNNPASALLDSICQIDPDYSEAQQARFEINDPEEMKDEIIGELFALAPNQRIFRDPKIKKGIPEWARPLAKVRASIEKGDLKSAAKNLPTLLGLNPNSALAAATHLELLVLDPETPDLALRQLAEHYQNKFPNALLPLLVLADSLIKGGQSDKGVGLIHKAASIDLTGQVARRLWGEDHAYRNLWPDSLSTYLEILVPAAVNGALGWNQLPSGSVVEKGEIKNDFHDFSETRESKGFSTPETLLNIDDDLEFASQKKAKRTGGKFPMYVVFSTRKGLERKYGPETSAIIISEMRKTTYAVRLKPGWGAIMMLADDPSSMANFGLKPTLSAGYFQRSRTYEI